MAILLILFFIVFGIISYRDYKFALGLFSCLLPAYVIRFSIGPLPSTVVEGMILILIFFWLHQKRFSFQAIKQSLLKASDHIFFTPGLLLVLSALVATTLSTDFISGLGIFKAYFFEPFLLYLILLDVMKTKSDWVPVFIGLGSAVLWLTVIALIQFITGMWLPTWEWAQPGSRRATGVYTSPNALGLFVAPVLMLFVAWLYAGKRKIMKTTTLLTGFQVSVIIAGALSILLAVSRGAMIGIAISIIVFLWWTWKKRLVANLAIFGVLIALLITPIRENVVNLVTFNVESGQTRVALYSGTVDLLWDQPFLGLGLASFADHYEGVRNPLISERLIYPHNILLNFWSETGMIGMISVLWIIGLVFRQSWRQETMNVQSLFLLALVPILIHGLVDVPYFKNDLAMLTWILLAGASTIRDGALPEKVKT